MTPAAPARARSDHDDFILKREQARKTKNPPLAGLMVRRHLMTPGTY